MYVQSTARVLLTLWDFIIIVITQKEILKEEKTSVFKRGV